VEIAMSISRIRKLFSESPVLDDTALNLSKKKAKSGSNQQELANSRYIECQNSWRHFKDQELNDEVRIEWFSNNGKFRGFLINDASDDVLGFFAAEASQWWKYPSFLKVIVVYVFDEHQGNGYGYAFYDGAINFAGGLLSDSTLTKASLGVWKKLASKYPVYMLANNGLEDEKLVKIDNLDAAMGNLNNPFVVSKSKLKV
jgi:hypothetical protein